MALLDNPNLSYVIIAIFIFLILASSIAKLINSYKRNSNNALVLDNLIARINAWWVICIILLLAIITGIIGTLILFAFISACALAEYLKLLSLNKLYKYLLLIGTLVLIPIQYLLIAVDYYAMLVIFIPVYVFLLTAIGLALWGQITNYLALVAKIQWGWFISIFTISHLPALLILELPNYSFSNSDNFQLIVFIIIVVQFSDVLQYIFGKLFGKTPILPKLSPNKTVEGFIGGILSASLLGVALSFITPFSYGQSFLIALVINLAGFCGGACMSAIKRDRQIKDFGSFIKGHGGMLDRIDSLCFAAPVFFHLVRYFYT